MKTLFIMLMMFGISFCSVACNPDNDIPTEKEATGNPNNPPQNKETMKMKITAGGKEFTAAMQDNETARALVALLPLTVNMSELNGNEKYYNLPQNLPGTAANPGTIQTGDIMLWSSNCLVLFYKTFSTSYSYVRLGRVDNVDGLAKALGTGNIQVSFEILNP
jgi:hypothetical protein